MALINTSLPNLIQGVSQQPDATRFSGQCDEQINFMSSVVDGLTKRNGTRFVKKILSSAISNDSFVHFINRSEEERYVLINNGTTLRAYNLLTGDEAYINGSSGGYSVANTYLDVPSYTTPRKSLKATTVADGTFLVNRTVPVTIDQTDKSPSLDKEALIFVKQGDYEKNYAIDVSYTDATPVAGQLVLRYTRYKDIKVYRYKLTAIQSNVPAQDGDAYLDGEDYNVEVYPSTYNSHTITVGEGVATINVAATSGGQLEASGHTITDPGPVLTFRNGIDVGNTVDLTVTLQEPTGLSSGSPFTKEVSIWSEENSHALHADTSRITNLLYYGPANIGSVTPTVDGGDYDAPKDGTGSSNNNPISNAGFEDVFTGITAGTNIDFSLAKSENLLVLTRASGGSDFKIVAKDGLSGGALGVVYKEVGAITDLPVYAKNGFVVKVRGDVESKADDYYVRFETESGETLGKGSWVETVAPNINLKYEEETLPMLIESDDYNSFRISHMKIAARTSGDNYSNPFSSFSDNLIQNSVFFKNRLGFVCSNNIILSEAGLGTRNDSGEFEYNFGRTTVTTLLDSDPIDVTVESNRVTKLTAATAVQENLILFADNGQFVLKGEELLTPRTVSVKPITNFEYNEDTDPVSVGSYIYYPFNFGQHTGIREFSLNKDTDVYESNAVTEQVPRYIPKDITYFAGSLTENLLAVLSKKDDTVLYMYRYFYSEGRKVLSSWFKWDFGVNIKGFYFMDSVMYIVATNDVDDETYILNLPLNFDGEDEGKATYVLQDSSGTVETTIINTPDDHVTHVDMRIPCMVYSNQVIFPAFTLGETKPLRESIARFTSSTPAPYEIPADYAVYTDRGVFVPSTKSNNVITLDSPGLPDQTAVWVGVKYDSQYVFSEQIFKGQAGQARTPNAAAKQFIKNLSLYHTRTSDYQVKVTPDKRSQYINTYAQTISGTGSSEAVELKDGFFRAPVFTSSEGVEISLENNGAMPSNFQSAEFETFIHTRSRRYGA